MPKIGDPCPNCGAALVTAGVYGAPGQLKCPDGCGWTHATFS